MGLFKPDFYRFFLAGFAAGAILVVANVEGGAGAMIADNVVPPAEAASTR